MLWGAGFLSYGIINCSRNSSRLFSSMPPRIAVSFLIVFGIYSYFREYVILAMFIALTLLKVVSGFALGRNSRYSRPILIACIISIAFVIVSNSTINSLVNKKINIYNYIEIIVFGLIILNGFSTAHFVGQIASGANRDMLIPFKISAIILVTSSMLYPIHTEYPYFYAEVLQLPDSPYYSSFFQIVRDSLFTRIFIEFAYWGNRFFFLLYYFIGLLTGDKEK